MKLRNMETNNYLTSEWKNSTRMIFWSTIVVSFAGIISTIYDYVSYVINLVQLVTKMLSSVLNTLGGNIVSTESISSLVNWGLSSKGLVVIGYVLYLWGLTRFASIQKLDTTSQGICKVRTATILLIIVFLLDIVFGVLSVIPFTGWLFTFIIWVMSLYCFYKMKNAFGELMYAEDFNDRARRGARNLRYGAVCEIRLRWLPLITGFVIMLIMWMGVMFLSSRQSLAGIEGILKTVGAITVIILVIAGIVALCATFCAFWWPIMGWYRVMTGAATEDTLEEQQQDELSDTLTVPVSQYGETQEQYIDMDEENVSWMEQNKKWILSIGGVGALGLLLWGAISVFGSDKKGNDLLPVQKPAWERFVVLTSNDVPFYKEPTVNSPQLEVMHEDLDTDEVSLYFKWSDIPNKKGYTSYKFTFCRDQVLPMIDENGEWYKVVLSDDEMGMEHCYISKSLCREISPQPITPELLSSLDSYNWCKATYGLQTEGKYKNICFISVMSDMNGEWLNTAVLYDGVLVNPLTKQISTQANPGWAYSFKVEEQSSMPVLIYGETILRDGILDARTIALEEKVGEIDVNRLFESIPTTSSKIQEVSYYFPDVDKGRLFTFTQHLTGNMASSRIDDVEDKKEFTGFNYVTDKTEEDGLELYAELDGEMIPTGISGFAQQLLILDQSDYDNDGEKEAIVYEWGGGNAVIPPYIVYYDKEIHSFRKAEGFDYVSEEPKVNVEQWNNKSSFVTLVGLRKDRYVYEDHTVKLIERISPDVGERVVTITLSQLFKENDDAMDRSINIDIDRDDSTEKLVFLHDESHSMDWGKSMILLKIEADSWKIPSDEEGSLGVMGSSFAFLASKSNGVPDILCDDAWLYKWDGEKYVRKE